MVRHCVVEGEFEAGERQVDGVGLTRNFEHVDGTGREVKIPVDREAQVAGNHIRRGEEVGGVHVVARVACDNDECGCAHGPLPRARTRVIPMRRRVQQVLPAILHHPRKLGRLGSRRVVE